MSDNVFYKTLVIGVLVLFMGVAVAPCVNVISKEVDTHVSINAEDDTSITCYVFDKTGNSKHEIVLSASDFNNFYSMFEELNQMITYYPFSKDTKVLKTEFVDLLDSISLIPEDSSKDDIISLMNPNIKRRRPLLSLLPNPVSNSKGTAFFCNFATWGEGSQFPVIILPRLIPILLTPIPRVIMHWNAVDGVTSCGGLLSGRGFIAEGAQQGTALGFWGIGFSVFLPPVMEFGFIGYALYATATAEVVHPWPPNRAPIISGENPPSGTWEVPLSLSELSFRISDPDDDLMDYTVTTNPDIGSGSGSGKKDGVYSIPVSGVEHDKLYSWTVRVSDGTETVEKKFGFFTEAGPPFNPFNQGWQYRKKITIDHDMVAGDLSDFPVLVSLVDNDLKDKAQFDGDDVLFMDGSGVAKKLYHEIERYDDSSGELVTWMNIPSLSSSMDTDFYMYYGNPSCSGQQFSERVWDHNYCGIWHFNDFTDSTHNNNDGTIYGATWTDGICGSALEFTGTSSSYVNCGSNDILNLMDAMTISVWVKPDIQSIQDIVFRSTSSPYKGYTLEIRADAFMLISYRGMSQGRALYSIPKDTWSHIVVTRPKDGYYTLYVNAVDVTTFSTNNSPVSANTPLYIGSSHGTSGWFGRDFDGVIDEVKILNKSISAEWISTEYHNQNDPLNFFNVGPEETAP